MPEKGDKKCLLTDFTQQESAQKRMLPLENIYGANVRHMSKLPRSLRSHAETFVAAGGLREECTLGRKLHFSFYAKAVPPPVSGSCEPYFRPNSVSC